MLAGRLLFHPCDHASALQAFNFFFNSNLCSYHALQLMTLRAKHRFESSMHAYVSKIPYLFGGGHGPGEPDLKCQLMLCVTPVPNKKQLILIVTTACRISWYTLSTSLLSNVCSILDMHMFSASERGPWYLLKCTLLDIIRKKEISLPDN